MEGMGGVARWERGHSVLRGLRNRLVATAVLLVGGIVWVLVYAAFWAGRFAWYQNLAVILSTFLIVPTVVLVMWVSWGIGVGRRMRDWVDDPFDL